MKNKKAVYILLPMVSIVWGLVLYRIFAKTGNRPDPVPSASLNTVLSKKKVDASDTFSLIANYRDPFLGKLPRSIKSQPKKKVQHAGKKRIKKPAPIPKPWPTIQYGGSIKNQRSNDHVAILKVQEEERMVALKEELKGIRVNQIFKDSVEVVYNNQTRIIHKQ